MRNRMYKYIAAIVIFVIFMEVGINALAYVKGIDDEFFKFYASYEDNEFKADNVAIEDKKWSTKENQKKGDWFVIDMLEEQHVGQIILYQNENNYPAMFNVYAAQKREDLIKPLILNQQGKAGGILTIDFPAIVNCRFLKIELVDGTEQNENPWDINSLTIMASNEASKKVGGYEVVKSVDDENREMVSEVLERIGIDFSIYDGTKSSFAKVFTEFYGIEPLSDISINFSDVKPTDENYNYIVTLGAVCEIEDKLFYPEKEITVIEALRYILDVMGYEIKTSSLGGYPNGYIRQAVKLGIVDSEDDCTKKADKECLKNIIYNALFSPVLEQTTYGVNQEFSATEELTCALYWHDIEKVDGILVSTDISSITGEAIVDEDKILIGDIAYKCNIDTKHLLGCAVTGYILVTRGKKEVIYICEDTTENRTITIPADNVVDFSNHKLRYVNNYPYSNNILKANIDKKADMIYNFKSKVPFDDTALKLKNGYIKLIDNDHDGTYDVVSVNEYVNYVVSYIDKNKLVLSDFYGKPAIELDETDIKYSVTNGSTDIGFSDIAVGDVVSVMADSVSYKSGMAEINISKATSFEFIVSRKQLSGEVTGMNDSDNIISIDGREYFFDNDYRLMADNGNAINPTVGMYYTFSIDFQNKVCDVQYDNKKDKDYALLLGAEGQKYAFSEDISLTVLTTEGVLKTFPVYKRVMIDGVRVSKDFSADKVKELFWEDVSLERIDEATGATISYVQNQLLPQVIGFRLNDNGEIAYIDTKVHNADKENSNTSIGHRDVATYKCNSWRGMVYPTELNSNPNLNYTGNANPIIFVGPIDVSTANIENDYAVHDGLYLSHDKNYEIELFKKSDFNDLEIAYIHEKAGDENARYKYVLVDRVATSTNSNGDVKKKLYGVKYGERYEAFFTNDTVLEKAGFTPNRGDLVIAETTMNGEIATISRLVDVKNPSLTLQKNDKYYSGNRVTIGQVYNSNEKNLMVTSTKSVSDPMVERELELFMFPDTAVVYDEEANEVRIAQISDVLAYKKTGSENRTSVIYACTTWGLHQSFVIYNFADYVPGV